MSVYILDSSSSVRPYVQSIFGYSSDREFRIYRGHKSKFKIFQLLTNIFRSTIEILEHKPKIIHLQWVELPFIYFFLFKILLRRKLVWTIHNSSLDHGSEGRFTKFKGIFLDKVYCFSDALIVHSNSSKLNLIKLFPNIPLDRIEVIPHVRLAASNFSCPKELINIEVPVHFSLLGQINKYKGYKHFLEAASLDGNRNYLIGGRFDNAAAVEIAKYAHLANLICINRYLDDAEFNYLVKCSICLVLPYSEIDASGIYSLACRLNKPIILSEIRGFRDLEQNDNVFVDLSHQTLYDKLVLVKITDDYRPKPRYDDGLAKIKELHAKVYSSLY